MPNRRLQLRGVRCSYPHLFQPRAVRPGATLKYSCAFLVPKNDPMVQTIMTLNQELLTEVFGANIPSTLNHLPIKDGDVPEVGQPGHWVVNSSAAQQPVVVDQNVQRVIDPQLIYPGCRVVANLSIFYYKQETGQGTTFGLDGIQFERDDERLDGRPTAEQMFSPVAGAPAPMAPGVTPMPAHPDPGLQPQPMQPQPMQPMQPQPQPQPMQPQAQPQPMQPMQPQAQPQPMQPQPMQPQPGAQPMQPGQPQPGQPQPMQPQPMQPQPGAQPQNPNALPWT